MARHGIQNILTPRVALHAAVAGAASTAARPSPDGPFNLSAPRALAARTTASNVWSSRGSVNHPLERSINVCEDGPPYP